MSPCERCDFIGPELPTLVRDDRELHRAVHEFTDAVFGPITDWQMRVLDRVMEARAKGVRRGLALPRRKWLRP
ncbi:MAG: hypothetical protein JJE50_01660 [Actinomycetales bacterium]|nr:hypothetical protein [Actinomycetales bacterium]